MWLTSLLRACFKTSKSASPHTGPGCTQSGRSSSDEDTPLRLKRRASRKTITGHHEELVGAQGPGGKHDAETFAPLRNSLHLPNLAAGMPHRPGVLLVPEEMEIRSPTDGVQRTPLPLTSPSLPLGSSTLHILRTPMPFGSPVPYPHSNGSPIAGAADAEAGGPASMQPGQGGIPSLAYTLPYELRQPEQKQPGSSVGAFSSTPMAGPGAAQQNALPKSPLAELGNAAQAQDGECETPAPFRFKTSSQGQGKTPRVSGIENPATSYKENKAVLLRHTPFAERVDKAVANENAFKASLSGHKRSGLGKAS